MRKSRPNHIGYWFRYTSDKDLLFIRVGPGRWGHLRLAYRRYPQKTIWNIGRHTIVRKLTRSHGWPEHAQPAHTTKGNHDHV